MNGKLGRGAAAAIGAVAVFVVVAVLFGFTVVSTDEDAALTTEFDPAAYVDSVWTEAQTAISDSAVDLAVILNQIQPDAEGMAATEALTPVAQANGLITSGDAHVYRVNASGTVTDVDTEHQQGHHRHRRRRLRRPHRGACVRRHAHPQRRVVDP